MPRFRFYFSQSKFQSIKARNPKQIESGAITNKITTATHSFLSSLELLSKNRDLVFLCIRIIFTKKGPERLHKNQIIIPINTSMKMSPFCQKSLQTKIARKVLFVKLLYHISFFTKYDVVSYLFSLFDESGVRFRRTNQILCPTTVLWRFLPLLYLKSARPGPKHWHRCVGEKVQ